MPTFDADDLELVGPPPKGKGKPGQPGGEPGGETDPDQVHKDIEDKLSRREEIGSEQEAKEKAAEASAKRPQPGAGGTAGTPGRGAISDLESREDVIAQIKPRYNWKSLIRQLITSSVPHTDITYAKPSRRAVTGITIAAQTGAGALKPGEKTMEENKAKLVFVFDTSGSMWDQVPRVLAETQNLIKQMGKSNVEFGVVFFADGYRSFVVNTAQNWYATVTSIDSIAAPVDRASQTKGFKSILSKQASGGTVFSSSMASQLGELATKGYNVMVFSDADILDSSNFKNFKSLWSSHKNHTFFVAVDDRTFKMACNRLGVVPRTFTHL